MFGDGDVMLRVLLKGKDESADELHRAARNVDEVGDQAKQSETALEKMGRAGSTAGDKIRTGMRAVGAAIRTAIIGAGALAAGAVVGGGGLIVKLIGTASEAEEISSKFDAVFKDLSGSVRLWAAIQSRAVNRSRYDFEQYLGSLQDTFVPLGFARDKAAELSKQLALLGVDLASFNNAAEPETIQLLTSALVGNHEAVRRFGIMITEATLKEEIARRAAKGLTLETIEQEKVMARLGLMMRMTRDAQGDAMRTSGEFANSWRGLKAVARDLAVDIGNKLLPAATDIVNKFGEWIRDLSDTGLLQRWGDAVATAVTKSFTFIQWLVTSGELGKVWESVKRVAGDAWAWVRDYALDAFNMITGGAGNMFSGLQVNFNAIASGIQGNISQMSETFKIATEGMVAEVDLVIVKLEKLGLMLEWIKESIPLISLPWDRQRHLPGPEQGWSEKWSAIKEREKEATAEAERARGARSELGTRRGVEEDAETLRKATDRVGATTFGANTLTVRFESPERGVLRQGQLVGA